jgi:sigma-B regulation protein RsbU (phosphoserine phosphatase)
MAFKVVLLISLVAQLGAVILAMRLNLRYRIYSAWVLISAAAFVMAVLRVASLVEIWNEAPSWHDNPVLWTTSISSLTVSMFLLFGLALVEPFFKQIELAQATIQHEHERLKMNLRETESELRLARQIQQDLFPRQAPELPGLDVAWICRPAEWTSGDFFDFVPLRSGRTAFVVADVCGHGLGPALLMAAARASIRAVARTVDDVGELLTLANPTVQDHPSSRFVTAFAATVCATNGTLAFAGAGQPAFLIRNDGSHQVLMAEAPPLGVVAEFSLLSQTDATLTRGDVLVLVTDGILETRNDRLELFGHHRLFQVIEENRNASAQTILQALLDATHSFASGTPQGDDITVAIVKVS